MRTERTPWRAWLGLGAALGVAPETFWRLSVREWRALMAPGGADALDRAGFEALMARFPDREND